MKLSSSRLRLWKIAAWAWAIIGLAGLAAASSEAPARGVLKLDGAWEFTLDRANEGRFAKWSDPAKLREQPHRPIEVPSCWEESEQDYEGVAWYAKTFNAPAEWRGRFVRVEFDAVNYLAEVWVNGEIVGDHEGGYTPFNFDLSDLLNYGGENTLVVRVVGPAVRTARSDMLMQDEAPHWRGGYVGGIWQAVRIVASEPVYVRDVFIEPKIAEKTALVHAAIENATLAPAEADVEIAIELKGNPRQPGEPHRERITIPPGGIGRDIPIRIEQPRLWSIENPQLYIARVSVRTQAGRDEQAVRFGMREFTVKDGRFTLNGEPIFIKSGFWEGQYPSTLARPTSEATVRREITLAKEAGFNLLRPWRMPPAPMTLDLADEMGMLIIGSPPIECMQQWPAETPQLERHWTAEMENVVRRDRNHPSIIMWETGNEVAKRRLYLMRHKVSLAARRLDPTRLVIDESGGDNYSWAQFGARGATGLGYALGPHVYLPESTSPTLVGDFHIYLRAPLSEPDYRRLATVGKPGKLNFISEVGYGSLPDLPANLARYRREGNPKSPDYRYHETWLSTLEQVMRDHQLNQLFPDASALCRASQAIQAEGNTLQLEALRANPKASGYCLHAFTDGDWVVGAGVLDLWREPKLQYEAIKKVNAPLYLAIHAAPQTIYAARGTTLTISAINEGAPLDAEFEFQVGRAADPPLPREGLPAQKQNIKTGVQVLYEGKLKLNDLHGTCTLVARLRRNHEVLAENQYPIWVFNEDDLKTSLREVTLLEFQGKLQGFFESRGVICRAFRANQPSAGPIVIVPGDAFKEGGLPLFRDLMKQVEAGATAIWLQPPTAESRLTRAGIFPLKLTQKKAVGMWCSVNHYARPHPAFAGLPTGGFMGQLWRNVAPRMTLMDLPGAPPAGCVSWDWTHDYTGPTGMWHGTDLAVIAHGKGRMILSMMGIMGNLGSDPVADRLLLNLCAM